MDARKVAQRYKLSSGVLWEKASEDLREFNQRYDEAQRIQEPLSVQDSLLLNDFAFRKRGTAPSFIGSGFYEWLSQCTLVSGDGHTGNPETHRPSGSLYLDVIDGKRPLSAALKGLDIYKNSLQRVVRETSPTSFNYQGFKVNNPEHMSEEVCLRLLEGVDYIVGLFKRRGMLSLLKDGVTAVHLLPKLAQVGWAGVYYTNSKVIGLSAAHLIGHRQYFGEFKAWFNDIFLHEFGHYVHLNYLTGDAKRAWDSAWDPVFEAKAKEEAIKQTFGTITQEEMTKFFDLLSGTNWEPVRVAKKLDDVARVKFAYWLRNPMLGGSLITEKQFRWTKRGLDTATFFRDPEKYIKEQTELAPGDEQYDWTLARRTRVFKERLGLGFSSPLAISPKVVEEMTKADPLLQKAVNEAIEQLGVVSEYSKTNEKEDFAETFVAFLDEPEKLTPTAKFRMQRALSLSGLYGKPVMRLAQKVAQRFEQASRSKKITLGYQAVDIRTGKPLSEIFSKREPARAVVKVLLSQGLNAGVRNVEAYVPSDWKRGDSLEPYVESEVLEALKYKK
jgi:hypothetical protein